MHVFNRRHVVGHLGEESEGGLLVSRAAEMASSSDAFATEAKNALAIVMEYSWAFAEYFEAVRVLVTGSSMGK